MAITLQFLGATRFVTGSRHLLTVNGKQVLLECGMVQGRRQDSNTMNRELGLDAEAVDAVVLSHAHIDHCGSLPRLVRLGYRGPIHCTEPTADLTEVMLHDSAHLQAQDAIYMRRKGLDWEPPYDDDDVVRTVEQLRRHQYHEPFEVLPGITVEFFDAGHIFGSAMEVVTIEDGSRTFRLGFTGDYGRKQTSVLRDPEKMPPVDALITESTYGDRRHDGTPEIGDKLAKIIDEEMRDGGRILVPAFAVGRTQGLLKRLGELVAAGKVPKQPVWVDSPMALKATKIIRRYPELYDDETRALLTRGRDPFFFDDVRFVQSVEESIALNDVRQGIIIASSGMCEGGRILHHLKRSLPRQEDCLLTVGFMAQHTLGRKLVDSARTGIDEVKVYGKPYPVRCKVRSILGLSAHADYVELLAALQHLAKATTNVFVVHGEEEPALAFADRLRGAGFGSVHVPVRGQKFEL